MPRKPPPHEIRERWMTVIGASFHSVTIFRFARERAIATSELIESVQREIGRLEQILRQCWSKSPLLTFWQGISLSLEVMKAGYIDTLKRLADFDWTWWRHGDRSSEMRLRRESTIKTLCIYDWLLSLFYNTFKSSFQQNKPWFLDAPSQFSVMISSSRRFSYPNKDANRLYSLTNTRKRINVELAVIRWTNYLRTQMASSIEDLRLQYNKGKVFEHYVRQLQWNNEEEQEDWEMDNIKWPYPDYSIKTDDLDDTSSKHYLRHSPANGVPNWEEDEELLQLF